MTQDPRTPPPPVAPGFERITLSDGTYYDIPSESGADENPLETMLQFLKTDAPRGAVDFVKRRPGAAGALAAGLLTAPISGGMSLLPSLATAAAGGALGAGAGLGINKLAGGEATRDMTLPQAGLEMLKEGAAAAGGEGTFRAVAGAGKLGANALMDSVLGTQKALRRDFGTVNPADVMNRHFINPTTQRGAAKAGRLRDEALDMRNALTGAADAAGTLPIDPAFDPTISAALEAVKRHARRQIKAGRDDPMALITARRDALDDANPAGLSMRDASDVINELMDEAEAATRSFKLGQAPHDIPAETAAGLAKGIRTVQRRAVPGVEPLNRRAQEFIEAAQAAEDVSKQPFRLGGWRSILLASPAAAYGANALTHSSLDSLIAGSIPLLLGTSKVAAPTAMTAYQLARLLGQPAVGRSAGVAANPWENLSPSPTPAPESDADLNELLRSLSEAK